MALILPQLILLTILLLTSTCAAVQETNEDVENEIHEFLELKPGYNLHQYPKNHAGLPVQVNFSVNVRSIFSLNEQEEILTTEMSIRMYWKESRLRLNLPEDFPRNYITLHPKVAENFWIPDVFIDRAKSVRVPTYHTKPTSLRIYNDSTMRYSSRLNFDVACDLNFRMFPADRQICDVNFESFGHDSKQIRFHWRPDLSSVNPNTTLTQFKTTVEMKNTYVTDYYDLHYPGVILTICLRRFIGYHVLQTYLPSCLFVCLAWLSMFVSQEVVPGRVGMGMTTLLSVTAMFAAVRQTQPRHAHVSYLDVWMVSTMTFVFLSLLEYIVVHQFNQKGKKKLAIRIEVYARMLYPVLYLGFNLVYWPNILKHYYDDKCNANF